jgi:hypothetical protein
MTPHPAVEALSRPRHPMSGTPAETVMRGPAIRAPPGAEPTRKSEKAETFITRHLSLAYLPQPYEITGSYMRSVLCVHEFY